MREDYRLNAASPSLESKPDSSVKNCQRGLVESLLNVRQ